MTKYRFYGLGGEKEGIFSPTFSPTTNYTIHLTPIYQFPPKSPAPISSRVSLERLTTPFFLAPYLQFARIGYTPQSLITRNPKALFEGKSERDRAFGGEQEPLPRLMRSGFKGDQPTLPLASKMGVKIPLKASKDEGLGGMDTNQGVEKRKPLECSVDEGWEYKGVEKHMAMCLCYRGLGDSLTRDN